MDKYFNLNDEVWVKGKIEEIIENKDGRFYKIRFEKGQTMFSAVILPESELIEKEGVV